jgi:CobW/HypB/UreG, nucleotide-binding domain
MYYGGYARKADFVLRIAAGVVLDCIVTVVDAKHIRRQLAGNRHAVSTHKESTHAVRALSAVPSGHTATAKPLPHSSPLAAHVHPAVSDNDGAHINDDPVPFDGSPDVSHRSDSCTADRGQSDRPPHLYGACPRGAGQAATDDTVRAVSHTAQDGDQVPSVGVQTTETSVNALRVRAANPASPAAQPPLPALQSPAAAPNEAQKQVAYADVILLNKVDLVSEQELTEVRAAVQQHNAAAAIIPCSMSRVPLSRILNTGAYRGFAGSLDVQADLDTACGHCGLYACCQDHSHAAAGTGKAHRYGRDCCWTNNTIG